MAVGVKAAGGAEGRGSRRGPRRKKAAGRSGRRGGRRGGRRSGRRSGRRGGRRELLQVAAARRRRPRGVSRRGAREAHMTRSACSAPLFFSSHLSA
eukprot:4726352-Prymnesium_polylepis.1